jgi:hypothetical protein
MNNYSVHFIDRRNFVFALKQVESSTDAAVIAKAREDKLPPYAAGFEVWREERLVYRGALRPPAANRDPLAATHQPEMVSA